MHQHPIIPQRLRGDVSSDANFDVGLRHTEGAAPAHTLSVSNGDSNHGSSYRKFAIVGLHNPTGTFDPLAQAGLTDIGRPEAHDEEADLKLQWFPLTDAVKMVLSGEIVNSLAVAGVLAAYAVSEGIAEPRPVDAPWTDRPAAFSVRKAAG